MPTPNVILILRGGIVRGGWSDQPVGIEVIDMDVDDDEATYEIDGEGGWLYDASPDCDAEEYSRIVAGQPLTVDELDTEPPDIDDDTGFDPYAGHYTGDC